MAAVDVKNLISDLRSMKVQPTYTLTGDDHYLQSLAIRKIAEAFFDSEPVNKSVLSPDEYSDKDILHLISASDLFSSRKLFVLYDPNKIRGNARDELLDYCRQPLLQHVLILTIEQTGRRNKFVTELLKTTAEIDVRPPFPSRLKPWIRYFFKEEGLSLESGVEEVVLQMAGDSLYHLANEIKKIAITIDGKSSVSVENVKAFGGWRRDHQRWEFLQALGQRNVAQSMKFGMSILSQNETCLSLLYPMTTLYQELLFLSLSSSRGEDRQPRWLPLPGNIRRQLPKYARNYNYGEISLALRELGKMDYRIKTTTFSDETALMQFVFSVVAKHGKN